MRGQPLNFKEIGFRKPAGSNSEKQLTVKWNSEATMDTKSIQVYEIVNGKKVPLSPDMVQPIEDLKGYVFTYNPSFTSHEYEIEFTLSDGTEVAHKVLYESPATVDGGNLRLPGTEGDVMIPVKPA